MQSVRAKIDRYFYRTSLNMRGIGRVIDTAEMFEYRLVVEFDTYYTVANGDPGVCGVVFIAIRGVDYE
jgi:hypothetical protein